MQPTMRPIAQAVQRQGRGEDTMLVHMTPREVGGLQALAMAHGGSLTINPQTGLPEAGFLKNLLPTLLGVALTPFMGPLAAGLTVGGVETVRTGDIGKGFLAGLGAYGGANLAGSLSSAGAQQGVQAASAAGQDLMNQAVTTPALTVTETGAGAGLIPSGTPATTIGDIYQTGGARDALLARSAETLPASVQALPTPTGAAPSLGSQYAQIGRGFGNVLSSGETGDAARNIALENLGGTTGAIKTAGMAGAPMIADALTPKPYEPPAQEKEESNYEGPYTPSQRRVSYPTDDERRRRTSEFTYFTPSNPVPFAEGGESKAASPDVVVTPNEAEVYQDIINTQRLAGLPALDPKRFAVTPGRSYEGFVYNPIGAGSAVAQGTGEKDYGIKALSQQSQNLFGGLGTIVYRKSGSEYTPFLVTGKIDPAKYDYDPAVGGYVVKPNASDVIGRMFSVGLGKGSSYATGGKVSVPQLEDGGFVLTKKAVDGLGRGSNKKGQKVASRELGAIPIKGPGTGTSDSIKTNIDGKRPALISNGEAYVPKRQVAKRGGAKAFYALMNKAEKAADRRKRA